MIRAAAPLLALLLAAPAAAQSHLLVVSGLGGEPQYTEAFSTWALAMSDAAQSRAGVPKENVVVLADQPDRLRGKAAGRATREAVLQQIRAIAARARPADAVVLVLIGHGSSDGTDSRFNLSGPDLTADDLAAALKQLPTQKVVVVNTASSSGGFIEKLSGRNRTIITATKSPFERNETVFGGYFVDAFAKEGADADKDGKVSMLEAFDYARREVARKYKEENRLLTEHAMLDDDGDGKGTEEPGRTGDGTAARTVFLVGGSAATASAAAASPQLRALLEQRRTLEGEVEQLKARKEQLPPAQYDAQLEELLLKLARLNRDIRQQGGGS